jgi:predicted MFS family arabinose efflux permease
VASTYGLARYSYGLFVPEIQAEFHLSTEVMGVIASGSYAGYLVATLFGSSISGVLGPRFPIVLGGLAATLGMLVIALSHDTWLLAFGVVLAGTSPGLAYPPLSDAVTQLITRVHQNRTYAVINSGTSLGVIAAGPAAFTASGDWRWAWLGFACFAAFATWWNARVIPPQRRGPDAKATVPKLRWSWFVGKTANRLFAAAFVFGTVTAVYWTFAVDLLIRQGAMLHSESRIFWVVIGAFGLLGGAAGDLVTRFGLRRTFRFALLLIAVAIGGLAIRPYDAFAAFTSAIVFGATFILITGLFGIWSVRVFHNRPSAGFGATFFLISAGQLVGPALSGMIAGWWGLPAAFQLSACACLVAAYLGPRQDMFSMTAAEFGKP